MKCLARSWRSRFGASSAASGGSAAAAQDLYTVSGVHVDASAASSAEALNVAIAQGRPKAWQILYRRLTRQQDWARQPALDARRPWCACRAATRRRQ